MTDNIMLDTNIWIYLYSKQSIEKSEIVRQLLASNPENLTIGTDRPCHDWSDQRNESTGAEEQTLADGF